MIRFDCIIRYVWGGWRPMDLALAGKRAIVTGGTGGLGIAIVRQLAAEGVRTALCSRSLRRATDAAAALDVPDARKLVLPAEVELKDPASVAAMVDSVTAAFG